MRGEYPGRRRMEVYTSSQGEVLRTPQGAKDEVAAGGRFSRSPQREITRSLQSGGLVSVGWRSPGRCWGG